jgi:hypothetical protein
MLPPAEASVSEAARSNNSNICHDPHLNSNYGDHAASKATFVIGGHRTRIPQDGDVAPGKSALICR